MQVIVVDPDGKVYRLDQFQFRQQEMPELTSEWVEIVRKEAHLRITISNEPPILAFHKELGYRFETFGEGRTEIYRNGELVGCIYADVHSSYPPLLTLR